MRHIFLVAIRFFAAQVDGGRYHKADLGFSCADKNDHFKAVAGKGLHLHFGWQEKWQSPELRKRSSKLAPIYLGYKLQKWHVFVQTCHWDNQLKES